MYQQRDPESILTPEQACEQLECSPSKLYRLLRHKKITHTKKLGERGGVQIKQADLDEYIKSVTVTIQREVVAA